MGCFRPPGRPTVLAETAHLSEPPTGDSLHRGREDADLLPSLQYNSWGTLQTVGSSVEQSNCCPVSRCSLGVPTDCGFCFPVCRTPRRLSVSQVSCPACLQAVVSTALSAEDPLGWLRLRWLQEQTSIAVNYSKCSKYTTFLNATYPQ